jgi:hypothetical protein
MTSRHPPRSSQQGTAHSLNLKKRVGLTYGMLSVKVKIVISKSGIHSDLPPGFSALTEAVDLWSIEIVR